MPTTRQSFASSFLGDETARVRHRAILMDHLHQQKNPAPSGYPRWLPKIKDSPPAIKASKDNHGVKIADPVALLENIKIVQQYIKLVSQATQVKNVDEFLQTPRHLEWFERLSGPAQGLDSATHDKISQLVLLHLVSTTTDEDTTGTQEDAAFALAKSLPHYDRDLTAFYLSSCPGLKEYELQVAHSILRLHSPPTLESLKRDHLPAWREQGLLHVLTVAAYNMRELADWGLHSLQRPVHVASSGNHAPVRAVTSRPDPHADKRELLSQLFTDGTDAIVRFILASGFEDDNQAFYGLLDRLAILMGVKSNAVSPEQHDLAAALAKFPRLELLPLTSAWASLKPVLEACIPPSFLRIDANLARKRAKQALGSWYVFYASDRLLILLLLISPLSSA